MNHYELRAESVKGELVTFKITDVPVVIRESSFILFNRENSPILKRSPITRSANYKGLFEGDIIISKGEEYCVVYSDELRCQGRNGSQLSLDDIQEFEKVSTIYADKSWNVCIKPQDLYKYRDMTFTMDKILGMYKDKILIGTSKESLDPSELQQATRISYNSRRVFFGDLVDGCPVVLYKGKPAINKNGKYYALPTKKEIK